MTIIAPQQLDPRFHEDFIICAWNSGDFFIKWITGDNYLVQPLSGREAKIRKWCLHQCTQQVIYIDSAKPLLYFSNKEDKAAFLLWHDPK